MGKEKGSFSVEGLVGELTYWKVSSGSLHFRASLLMDCQVPWVQVCELWENVGGRAVLDLCFAELCPDLGEPVAEK